VSSTEFVGPPPPKKTPVYTTDANTDFVVSNIHKHPKPNVQFVFHVYTDTADVGLFISMKSESLTSYCTFYFMDVDKCISKFCDCCFGSVGYVTV